VSVDGAALVTETARVVGAVDYRDTIAVVAAMALTAVAIICSTASFIYDRKKGHEALLDAHAHELELKQMGKE